MRRARRIFLPVLVAALAIASGDSAGSSAVAPALGSVSGRVTSSTTSQGLFGSVTFARVTDNSLAGFANVDASGNYSINLPPGDYRVKTHNTLGYINELYPNIPCSVVCDTTNAVLQVTSSAMTGIDFVLDPGGRMAGTITDSSTGLPIANAAV